MKVDVALAAVVPAAFRPEKKDMVCNFAFSCLGSNYQVTNGDG
jgi:hypothetical protein